MESPDLTLNLCGGKVTVREGQSKERYKSLAECSNKRNIPLQILSSAKAAEAIPHHGFKDNGSIHWDELQQWLADDYTLFVGETLTPANDKREELELRKLMADVIKAENFNKAKSKEFIRRKEYTRGFNTVVGNILNTFARYLIQEQPQQCNGMNANQILANNKPILNRMYAEWKNQKPFGPIVRIWI